jgi:uncharacterized protein with HEPN domain
MRLFVSRNVNIYLEDIVSSCDKISTYIIDLNSESFKEDNKTVDAVVRNIEIIGEAASKITEDIRNKHQNIEWKAIIGMRNILIHEYFGVDVDQVWLTATEEIPALRNKVAKILQ